MTFTGSHCMTDDPQVLSRRLATFVRSKGTAKELHQIIGCDIRTAENIRRGHWPVARHWLRIWQAFGDDVIEAVFHPERAVARLEQEVRELEAAAAKARAELRDLQGPGLGVPQALARHEDRAAEVGERHRSFDPQRP